MNVISLGPSKLQPSEIEYFLGYSRTVKTLLYYYDRADYDAEGEAILVDNDSVYYWYIGHCSCHGPISDISDMPNSPEIYSTESFIDALETVTGPICNPLLYEQIKEELGINNE